MREAPPAAPILLLGAELAFRAMTRAAGRRRSGRHDFVAEHAPPAALPTAGAFSPAALRYIFASLIFAASGAAMRVMLSFF